MRTLCLLVCSVVLAFALPSSAHALAFTFSGSDAGGTGSATMDIIVSGMSLIMRVDNTSPTTLDDGTGVNAPGITAFGFDLAPNALNLLSWDLTAYDLSGNLFTIGRSGVSTGDWILTVEGNTSGIKMDYVPNTRRGVKGALYNPVSISGQAALPNYYTQAVLNMAFDDIPILSAAGSYSPIVRMQNVGLDGEGSLKLPGTPAPEPATMVLFGSGLIGMAVLRRKKLSGNT